MKLTGRLGQAGPGRGAGLRAARLPPLRARERRRRAGGRGAPRGIRPCAAVDGIRLRGGPVHQAAGADVRGLGRTSRDEGRRAGVLRRLCRARRRRAGRRRDPGGGIGDARARVRGGGLSRASRGTPRRRRPGRTTRTWAVNRSDRGATARRGGPRCRRPPACNRAPLPVRSHATGPRHGPGYRTGHVERVLAGDFDVEGWGGGWWCRDDVLWRARSAVCRAASRRAPNAHQASRAGGVCVPTSPRRMPPPRPRLPASPPRRGWLRSRSRGATR